MVLESSSPWPNVVAGSSRACPSTGGQDAVGRTLPSCTTRAEGVIPVVDADGAATIPDAPLSPPGHSVEQVMGATRASSVALHIEAAPTASATAGSCRLDGDEAEVDAGEGLVRIMELANASQIASRCLANAESSIAVTAAVTSAVTTAFTSAATSAAMTGMRAANLARRRALFCSHSARRWWDSSIDANLRSRRAAQAEPLNMVD
jgi:hypothetical protein